MGNKDASRVEVQEGAYTFKEKALDKLLLEIDGRLNGNEVYIDITRSSDLISKVEYFSDLARTKKLIERNFTRVAGVAGILFVDTITTIFFNDDATEDSRVTTTSTRDTEANNSRLLDCDNPFSTSESQKL